MANSDPQEPVEITAAPTHVEQGHVTLPFGEDKFRDFVRSLLGSPQSVGKVIEGPFEVGTDDLANIHHLLHQRITQQNDATAINFSARIEFNDASSIDLGSLVELTTFNEPRPVVSDDIHLTWDYLIRFQDKSVPEKQRIQISFTTDRGTFLDRPLLFIRRRKWQRGGGAISYRIEHTARTWGADIGALLSSHLQTLRRREPRHKVFAREHSGVISLSLGLAFLVGTAVWATHTASQIVASQLAELQQFLSRLQSGSGGVIPRLDRMLDLFYKPPQDAVSISAAAIVALAVMFGLPLFIWVENSLSKELRSFVVLTRQSRTEKALALAQEAQNWRNALGAVALSLAVDILANVLFATWHR